MANKKVALVLAGGGIIGIAFEIGVLRALDQVWLNRKANQFDLYVGTSAGSYVASYLASGIPVERLSDILKKESTLLSLGGPLGTFFPNVGEVIEKLLLWPVTLTHATNAFFKTRNPLTGLQQAVQEWLPTGLFDTWVIQSYLYRNYRRYGVGNRFADLPHDLFIIATDLENGARSVFSKQNEVPLEKAVAASCAVPLIYRPVRINGRDYVDGGVRGTASIDLAIEEGADLIIVVNPLVPYSNQPESTDAQIEREHLTSQGPLAVSNQVARAMLHSGLVYHIKHVKSTHPHVNIMLIEPPFKNSTLALRSIFSYDNLEQIADYGFEVGLKFWQKHEQVAREILAQREIELANTDTLTHNHDHTSP